MSDRNLLCIILTFGLAFFTIGNAFRAGNYVLGLETIFIWLFVYLIMPLAKIIDKKLVYEKAPVDWNALLFRTVQNGYLFISFCISLLLSILFSDLVDASGHFFNNSELVDIPVISLLVAFSALFSLVFYALVSRRRIERLKLYGIKTEAKVEDVKAINDNLYIKAYVVNPLTGEEVKLVGVAYSKTKEDIPSTLPVYFDKKDPFEYFFDSCCAKD